MSSTLVEELISGSGSVTRKDALLAFGRFGIFLVALGMALLANAIVSAMFGIGNKLIDVTVGWIPWVGGKVKGPVHTIETRVTNFLGEAAHGSAHQVGLALHTWGQVLIDMVQTLFLVGAALATLTFYLARAVGIAAIGPRIHRLEATRNAEYERWLKSQATVYRGRNAIGKAKGATVEAEIFGAIKPLQAEIADLTSRIGTLEHAIPLGGTVAIPEDIAGLKERVKEAERGVENLWKRVRGLDKVTVGTVAGALVASALLKLGLGWLKCSKVGRFGKGLCRMPGHWFDSLLGLLADFVVITNICQVLPWLETAASDIAAPMIRVLSKAGAGICHGTSGPAPALRVPTLHLPAGDTTPTLHLP